MSTGPREDGGVPRIRRALAAIPQEDWHGANEAKTDLSFLCLLAAQALEFIE